MATDLIWFSAQLLSIGSCPSSWPMPERKLQTINLAAAARKTQELQQKRIKARGNRLDHKFGRKGPK